MFNTNSVVSGTANHRNTLCRTTAYAANNEVHISNAVYYVINA